MPAVSPEGRCFAGIDFIALTKKKVMPPYLPVAVNNMDTSNFDEAVVEPDLTAYRELWHESVSESPKLQRVFDEWDDPMCLSGPASDTTSSPTPTLSDVTDDSEPLEA